MDSSLYFAWCISSSKQLFSILIIFGISEKRRPSGIACLQRWTNSWKLCKTGGYVWRRLLCCWCGEFFDWVSLHWWQCCFTLYSILPCYSYRAIIGMNLIDVKILSVWTPCHRGFPSYGNLSLIYKELLIRLKTSLSFFVNC